MTTVTTVMTANTLLRLLVLVAGLLLLTSGLWAMLAPDSFYAVVATYPPYNRHLIHDLGAFLLGLGATLALALAPDDALLVAPSGNAIAGSLFALFLVA